MDMTVFWTGWAEVNDANKQIISETVELSSEEVKCVDWSSPGRRRRDAQVPDNRASLNPVNL